MYNVFWRLASFLRGQSFSVKTFDRSRNGCQVIREGAGNDFRGPSVQALPFPSRVSFSRFLSPRVSPSRAPVFSCAHYFQAPATQAKETQASRGRIRDTSHSRKIHFGAGWLHIIIKVENHNTEGCRKSRK